MSLQETVNGCSKFWHLILPLHSIYPRPWRNKSKDSSNNIDKNIRSIVFVSACSPQLIQTSSTDDECRIDFQAIASECRVFEVFLELLEVTLESDVWEVRHHVGYDLEASIFGEMERLGDCTDGMATVGVPRNVFIDGLHANF